MQRYGLIYLATPYSKYRYGLDAAWEEACRIAGNLIKKGATVYSPIIHMHPIAMAADLDPYDHAIWVPLDHKFLYLADALFVAKMLGWEGSRGIQAEVSYYHHLGKPIYYLDPRTLKVEQDMAHRDEKGRHAPAQSKTAKAMRGKEERVMHEFKHGSLHSGSKKGPKVTERKQAVAIAMSEGRKAASKARGR